MKTGSRRDSELDWIACGRTSPLARRVTPLWPLCLCGSLSPRCYVHPAHGIPPATDRPRRARRGRPAEAHARRRRRRAARLRGARVLPAGDLDRPEQAVQPEGEVLRRLPRVRSRSSPRTRPSTSSSSARTAAHRLPPPGRWTAAADAVAARVAGTGAAARPVRRRARAARPARRPGTAVRGAGRRRSSASPRCARFVPLIRILAERPTLLTRVLGPTVIDRFLARWLPGPTPDAEQARFVAEVARSWNDTLDVKACRSRSSRPPAGPQRRRRRDAARPRLLLRARRDRPVEPPAARPRLPDAHVRLARRDLRARRSHPRRRPRGGGGVPRVPGRR